MMPYHLKLDNGNYEIGIHIDVSYYLEEGTILDDEAYQRATSVYLVDRVVPMLPEVLSNFACSLRPQEEKYTFSAILKFQKKQK
jgi:ribonuclease R